MLSALLGCASMKPAPKGKLVYCSYARTGAAGLGLLPKDMKRGVLSEDCLYEVLSHNL